MSKDTKISFRADDLGKWLSGADMAQKRSIQI
jgi:hypothetical protein